MYSLVPLYSQDWLQLGYSTLVRTLLWFLKKATDLEHDDYMCMLKMVCFDAIRVSDQLCDLKTLFSLGKGPMVLEEMTHQN